MIDGTVSIDGRKYAIESTIAEGGFGYVHKVRDQDSNIYYALKKINSTDKETQSEIENEVDILKSLQKHPHIMEFIAYTKVALGQNGTNNDGSYSNGSTSNRNSNKFSHLILCELCDRGTLADLEFPIQQLERSCRVIYQVSKALKHMHGIGVIHRDIKAENILFDNNGQVKLCDFGSSTRDKYEPNIGWTPLQRATVEEEMQRHTTPLYRPPEILETYLHYPINCAIDVWALGCLTYFMRFGQHAFPDSGKLSIVNCCYSIPKDVSSNDPLVSIIKQCLKPDPNERISVQSLINSLQVEFNEMDLEGSIVPFTPKQPSKNSGKDPDFQAGSPDQMQSSQEVTESKLADQSPPSPKMSTTPIPSHKAEVDLQELDQQSAKVDTLIELGNTSSSSASSFENSRKSPSVNNIKGQNGSYGPKTSLPEELLRPVANTPSVDNIDVLLNMDGLNLSNQKILSPKKTTYVSKTNSNDKRCVFDDLLDSFGTTISSNGGSNSKIQTIGSAYSCDGFEIDSKEKIIEWKDSRRGNIRALLSSLHLVLSDEFKWKQIGMHQLVTDADVKKIYRSACLAVHPDKVINCDDDTKEVAKMVFTELNEAWSKFEGK